MGNGSTVAFHPVRIGTWHPGRGNPSYFSLDRNDRISFPFHGSKLMVTFIILPLCHATCVCNKILICLLKWQRQLRGVHSVKNLPVWLRCTDTACGTMCSKSQLVGGSPLLWSNKVHGGDTYLSLLSLRLKSYKGILIPEVSWSYVARGLLVVCWNGLS